MIEKLAYGVEEATSALGISRSRIYELIASGDLKSYMEGRRRLISRRALNEYVDRKEREGRAAA